MDFIFAPAPCINFRHKILKNIENTGNGKINVTLFPSKGTNKKFFDVQVWKPFKAKEYTIGQQIYYFKSSNRKEYIIIFVCFTHMSDPGIQICFGLVQFLQNSYTPRILCTDGRHGYYSLTESFNEKNFFMTGDRCFIMVAIGCDIRPLCLIGVVTKKLHFNKWADWREHNHTNTPSQLWNDIQSACEHQFIANQTEQRCDQKLDALFPEHPQHNNIKLQLVGTIARRPKSCVPMIPSKSANALCLSSTDLKTTMETTMKTFQPMPWHGISKSTIISRRPRGDKNMYFVTGSHVQNVLVKFPDDLPINQSDEYFIVKRSPHFSYASIYHAGTVSICCSTVSNTSDILAIANHIGHLGYWLTLRACEKHPHIFSNFFLTTLCSQVPVEAGDRVVLMVSKNGRCYKFMAVIGAYVKKAKIKLWSEFGLPSIAGSYTGWQMIIDKLRTSPPPSCSDDLTKKLIDPYWNGPLTALCDIPLVQVSDKVEPPKQVNDLKSRVSMNKKNAETQTDTFSNEYKTYFHGLIRKPEILTLLMNELPQDTAKLIASLSNHDS